MRTTVVLILTALSLSASSSFGQPTADVAKTTPEQKALAAIQLEHDQAESVKNKKASAALSAQACSVGYLPSQFAGKPDPWPNNVPLPNDQLLAAYKARYGQDPGSGGTRIGYCCELFGLNYEALENAAKAGAIGPGGEHLHPGCASTTEVTDASFTIPRGGPFIGQWVAATRDGGTPGNPIVVHDTAKACGPYTDQHAMFGAYPIYYNNTPPCGTGGQPAVCGNGKPEAGETCESCPQDVCPSVPCAAPKVCTAPCPTLVPVPSAAKDACKLLAPVFKKGTGRYKLVRDVCEVINHADSYKPGS